MKKLFLAIVFLLISTSVFAQNPTQLRVNLDATGNLEVVGAVVNGSITGCLFINCRLAVDSSGNLSVIINGGTISPSTVLVGNSSAANPSYSFTSNTDRGIFNSTTNNGIGFSVGGAQQGFWNAASLGLFGNLTFGASSDVSVSRDGADILALKRGTNAQTIRLYNSTTGPAYVLFNATADGALTIGGASASAKVTTSTINATLALTASSSAPTLTSCGTGTINSNSSNNFGEVTATGTTSCTVNFTNSPFATAAFCTIEEETTIATTRVSAISTSAFTVTGLTSGDKFMYVCGGK